MYPVSDPQLVIDSHTFKCTSPSALSSGATQSIYSFEVYIPNKLDIASNKNKLDQVRIRKTRFLFKCLKYSGVLVNLSMSTHRKIELIIYVPFTDNIVPSFKSLIGRKDAFGFITLRNPNQVLIFSKNR